MDSNRGPYDRVDAPISPALDLRAYRRPGQGSGRGGAYPSGPGGAVPPSGYGDSTQYGGQTDGDFFSPIFQSNRTLPVMGDIVAVTGPISTDDVIILPRLSQARIFLFISNEDAANTFYVSFGIPSNAAANSGAKAFAPGASFNFQDFIPQNEIHVIATAANTAILIYYSLANFPFY